MSRALESDVVGWDAIQNARALERIPDEGYPLTDEEEDLLNFIFPNVTGGAPAGSSSVPTPQPGPTLLPGRAAGTHEGASHG